MPGPATLFREVHRLLQFIHDLEETLARIPRTRKAHLARLAKAEQTLKDEQETIKKLKVATSEKEKSLKAKTAQIQRGEQKYNEVTTKKEIDALKLELTHARESSAQLEDEILTALTDIDERSARIPALEKAVASVKADLATFDAEAGKRQADLGTELARAKTVLAEAEKQIPRQHRDQYERSVSAQGPDGFALVRGRNCTACNTEITRQCEVDLSSDMFVVCKSCGRIQYPELKGAPAQED